MSAIDALFQQLRSSGRKAFMPFVTAGDPDLDFTAEVIRRLAARGCSLVELGIPYSDSVADGPVIQASYTRALARHTKLACILAMVERLTGGRGQALCRRRTPQTMRSPAKSRPPSPADRHDAQLLDRFSARAGAIRGRCETGGRGRGDRARLAGRGGRAAGRRLPPRRFLAHPTHHADDAARSALRIAERTTGFIYYVSVTGITGERTALPPEIIDNVGWLRRQTPLPICIGFGISRPEHVRMLAPVADGLIVGSAIVRRIAEAATKPREQVLDEIGDYAAELLAAIENP